MKIRIVTDVDIPQWLKLSSEHDCYVYESVQDLSEWYDGNENSISFSSYMKSKILQQEAFMSVDRNDVCLGIISFSKKSNNITFFGISRQADFRVTANALFQCAFEFLDTSRPIFINEIISTSEWMNLYYNLYHELGFVFFGNSTENGVPVRTLVKTPSTHP